MDELTLMIYSTLAIIAASTAWVVWYTRRHES